MPPTVPPSPPATGPSLKRRALTGSAWALGSHVVSQLLRFGSNLILTHLLVPEMFGLMTLVNVFVGGLQMLSDVGIGPSIVQNRRGDDPLFLNTAWTIQIVRGFILWIVSCLFAWPLAALYGKPDLAWMIPVVGLTALIAGFNSTALFTRTRHISLGRLTVLELASQVVAAGTMVGLACFHKSAWVLVAGSLIGATLRAVLSHTILEGRPNRLVWNREAAAALLRFGKWIFLATVLTYCWVHADKFLLGYFMTGDEFGVYSVAFILSQAVLTIVTALSDKVILPVYARLGEGDPAAFAAKVHRLRRSVLAATLPLICVVAVVGPAIIRLVYDSRYQDAGWMLQILAVGSIIPVLIAPLSALVLARGESRLHMILMGLRLVLTLGAMFTGGLVAGTLGLITGYALAPLLFYPIQTLLVSRPYGVWTPGLDLCATVASVGVIGLGIWITS